MDIAGDGQLDLDDCAAEPIRTPGATQPHGWLLAHDAATARLVAYSDNCEQLTGLASGPIQTTALQAVLDDLRSRSSTEPQEGSPASILRTPLSSIASAAKLIGRLAATTDNVSDLVAMIKRNVALEARLIDDLLDLGAVTAGKPKLALEPVDIDGLVAQVVDMLRQELVARGLRIELVPCVVARPVDADPVRMQQVLWNIVRNAVKFTPSGGHIRIASELRGGDFVVTCTDSGIGIAADDLARIFVAYQQASIEAYQRSGGLGLGLAIATAIVRSHGGQLEAASDGVDRGATFTIRLPAGTAR